VLKSGYEDQGYPYYGGRGSGSNVDGTLGNLHANKYGMLGSLQVGLQGSGGNNAYEENIYNMGNGSGLRKAGP
jgi:hypothetical protein